MHYYQHHIGDFIRDTSCLTDTQSMAYLRLLWMYYESETPLVNNPKVLALRVGTDADTVSLLLEAFFKPDGDFWRHTRCDAEIEEYQALRERNKTNGKAGGRPKKTQSVSIGLPVVSETEPSCNPNHKPITNNQINIKDTQAEPAKSPEMTFDKFVESRELQGLTAIIESDPVWAVIDSLGMPDDFAVLQWRYIESQYSTKLGGKAKRYKQWPTVLAKALRELWGQLFFKHETQGWILTSKGKNLKELAA